MARRGAGWLCALIATLIFGSASDAGAATPRVVVEAGQRVAGGSELLGIGPSIAVNDADQVVYLATIRKGRKVRVAVMRNRKRMVWEGKKLKDGSRVIDIEEDACPDINEKGEVAVHALIQKGGLQRKAVIGSKRALTWIGRKVGGRTITRWDNPRCAQIDDRGRIAYFANFEGRDRGRGVFLGNRPIVTVGKILKDGSQVTSISENVAVNGKGRIVVGARLSPSSGGLISRNAVLLRDGDVTLDGSLIEGGILDPEINDKGKIVAAASTRFPTGRVRDPAIVSRGEVILRRRDELPDGAVLAFGFLRSPVIDRKGRIAILAPDVEHEGRQFGQTAIVTPAGVVAIQGDRLADGRALADFEPPVISGKGRLAFVASLGGRRAILLGEPTPGCRNLLDHTVPVPEGFGAAFGVGRSGTFDRPLLNVRVRCGFGQAVLQVGSGRSSERVSPEAFVWKDGGWQEIRLKGEEQDADGWFIGSASADLDLSQADLRAEQRVRAQTCIVFRSTEPKCGCRDFSCRETFWQLQRFVRAR